MLYNNDFEKFTPNDYYLLAKELFEKKNELDCNINALLRCIASRTYYAAFLQIREYLKNQGYYFKSREHKEIHDILEKNCNALGSEFFNNDVKDKLWALKKNRVHCDYHFNPPNTHCKKSWCRKDLEILLSDTKWILDNVKVEYFK